MKTLVILCIVFVYVASSPAKRSFFDDDDDDPFAIFRVPPPSAPKRPQWGFPSFPTFSFEPFFSMFSMLNLNPLSDPKTQLYNSTVEEKVIDGHVMTVNTSYYINNDTGSVMHVQTVNVKPIELKPPKETPTSLDTTTSTTEANKDAENEVHGGADHASEAEDLIA